VSDKNGHMRRVWMPWTHQFFGEGSVLHIIDFIDDNYNVQYS